MLKVRDSASLPKKDWKYVDPEDGTVLKSPYYRVLLKNVKAYRRANNRPIGVNFDEEYEANLCAHNPDACVDFVPPTFTEKMGTVFDALKEAARNWREPVVSTEELNRRRDLCAQCNYFGGFRSMLKVGCKKCGCLGFKLALASSKCPHENPRW